MKKFEFEEGDLYISEDLLRYLKKQDKYRILDLVGSHFYDFSKYLFDRYPHFKKYIDEYGRLNNLKRYAVLDAHGDTKNGKWAIRDGKKKIYLQNIIDRIDDKYCGILLQVCNPRLFEVESKTPLIIPDGYVITNGYGGKSVSEEIKSPLNTYSLFRKGKLIIRFYKNI